MPRLRRAIRLGLSPVRSVCTPGTLGTLSTVRTLGFVSTVVTLGAFGTVFSGCAARGPSLQAIAEVKRAEALLLEGCYRCLEETLDAMEQFAGAPHPPTHAARLAFEAAILLTVRAKELGVPAEPFLLRARRMAHALATTAPAGVSPAVYLDAAEQVMGDTSGLDPEVREERARTRRQADADIASARAQLTAAVPADTVAAYLTLALDCDDGRTRREVRPDAVLVRHGDSPLLRYRLAICGAAPADLVPLRTRDPRWVDTHVFEGWRQMATRPVADVPAAAASFEAAHAAFPASHAIMLALAAARNALGEYGAALALYDRVLADEPTHRDALLGRVMSLSYLTRYVDAVTAATRLIALGTWHIGDAHYWRAWNRYQLHQLPAAWADVEHATTLLVNTSVYTLAGYIAYARTELDTAIDRFDRAYVIDHTNCEAAWFGGLVHVDLAAWTAAASKFSTAMDCFTTAAADARAEIAATERAAYAEATKIRRIAAARKRAETGEHRSAQAALNAANCFLRLGRKVQALAHADRATGHPLLKDKAASLKAEIDKLPE